MRLLLAEDERRAGEYLVKGLGESGFVVDWVRNGVDALHRARSEVYDLIVLDIGLPQLDGWAVLEHIRQERQTPVLFLTARDRVEDRVRGFEIGADDYLIKPFAFSELLARIRALLRRGKTQEPDILRVADLGGASTAPSRGADRAAYRAHREGVRPALAVPPPSGRGAVAHDDRRTGVGHELR